MGIQVECPNGHMFKVKDKYAGKKGLCPHCEGQVIVQVPDALTANPASDVLQREAIERRQATHQHAAPASVVERLARVRRSEREVRRHPAAARAAACWARA